MRRALPVHLRSALQHYLRRGNPLVQGLICLPLTLVMLGLSPSGLAQAGMQTVFFGFGVAWLSAGLGVGADLPAGRHRGIVNPAAPTPATPRR